MVSLELFTKYYTIGCIAQFKETYPANPLYKLLNGTVNDEYMYQIFECTSAELSEYMMLKKKFFAKHKIKFKYKKAIKASLADPDVKAWFDYCVDFLKEHLDYIYRDFCKNTDVKEIYRALFVNSADDIDLDNLGHSWTYDLDMAKTWAYNKTGNMNKYIVCAENNPNNVHWPSTILHYAIWTDPLEHTGERELKLKNNSKIKVKWIKNFGHI